MSSDEISNSDVTEKIKILATDDERIKSFGEIFTNNSSREILQLLFNERTFRNTDCSKDKCFSSTRKIPSKQTTDFGCSENIQD